MIFVGIDWAEAHHDVCLVDEGGQVQARRRVAEGLDGVGKLHALIAEHAQEPASVVDGIETDRGLLVGSLVAAGYQVFAINPMAASRYRDRHATSGAKSDPGDARVLADLVRTDRHQHRPVAGDSELAEAVKVLARAHQSLIWTRQRQVNQLRNTLREFYPGALVAFEDLDAPDALAVFELAPTPSRGRALSRAKIASALRRAGRRNAENKRCRSRACSASRNWRRRCWWLRPMATASPPAWLSSSSSTSRSPASSRNWPRVLKCTRTPRSTSVFPDSVASSAPGLEPSSVTTGLDSHILRRARTTPARHPSRRRRGPGRWSSLGWREIGGSPTPVTAGLSQLSRHRPAPGVDTTPCGHAVRLTIKPCEPSAIVWSASFTVVSSIARPIVRTLHGARSLKLPLDISSRGMSRMHENR